MEIKCLVKDCKYNINNTCNKEEIEICKVSAYDENSAECIDYEKISNT